MKEVKCTFVPTMGGLGTGGSCDTDIHSNRIAMEFARIFGAKYVDFFAPAVFSDRNVMKGFMNENFVKNVLQYYQEMRTVILGIGTPNQKSSMVKAGYLSASEMKRMVEQKAVGDLSLQFYDKNGNADAYQSFNERVVGMSLKQLKGVENRIVVACGAEKAEAIHGALEGGYVNILVIDEECAKELIRIAERERN